MEKEQGHYERLILSFRAMGAGLWDYDIDADTLFCDAGWYAILGIDERKTPVRRIGDFEPHIHPDDREIATERVATKISSLLDGHDRYDIEFRIVRPNGDIRWLRSVACLIRDAESGHRRAVGCITDITDFRAGRRALLPLSPTAPRETDGEIGGAAGEPASEDTDTHSLSNKERECLMWVSLGKTAWETATIIGRSRRTVEFHLDNAVRKLGASNKVHAVVIAIRSGYL